RGAPYDLMFFSELSDPKWVPLLSDAGVFANVPTTVTRGDVTYYARHVPLIGLAKLAAIAGAEGVAILQTLHLPENPQVRDQILRIVSAIQDLSLAPRLVPILTRLFETHPNSEWLWLDDILATWLKGDARRPCFDVLTAFLHSMASNTREHA